MAAWAAVRRHDGPQLPEWPPEWPDIAWPVDPKPPRAVEDVEEDDDEELVPLCSDELFDVKPTDVEFGGRFWLVVRSRELELEPEYQCQPRELELDELERLQGCCAAGCAPGAAAPCTAGLPRSMMSRTGAGCGAGHSVRAGSM